VQWAIEIDRASVVRDGREALREVSLRVREREFLGIFGPNGAGKTTLLRLINGLLRPTRGSAMVRGAALTRKNAMAVRAQTGYVPQSLAVDPRMPVLASEAVLMGRYGRLGLLRRPAPADFAAAEQAMREVGILHLAERPVGRLSGGEQQRVAIARALAQEPAILLLDEPTSSLDLAAQRSILALVRRVHDGRGMTTIMVSHDAATLAEACDRVVLMKAGRIVGECEPQVLTRQQTVAALFTATAASGE
jgi:ABC-type cobalamin/Fe3+-siderophores transport system ATPase subunit